MSNTAKLKPKQIREISARLSRLVEGFHGTVANVRISDIAVEFDLFIAKSNSANEVIRALSKFGAILSQRNLREEVRVKDKDQIMELIVRLFNEQRYWECHEVLEYIWKVEKDPDEKNLQNGIILAASALVHAQKDEDDVCLRMLERSLSKLDSWKGCCYHGFDVDSLKNCLKDLLSSRNVVFRKI
ncbi:MAG: DUF309 domain-containing protein [Nitrososphaerota archaeon]|nr:DUF309 domain-containing protein [Nitrososphaerota archaeon]MDG6924045.1 DUF309 domain-containing protein [Nitrososphaerota archaeon]